MVCPYCSADIEPIELNGKVFCSNCGLTIANNSHTTEALPVVPDEIKNISTQEAEEVPFSVSTPPATEPEIPILDNQELTAEPIETENIPRKLEVTTEESTPPTNSFNPITEEAIKDLGFSTNPSLTIPEGLEINEEATAPEENPTETPVFESKISELSIPSEEDFGSQNQKPEELSSYIELANPGNEVDSLEASGILLDILGENKKTEVTVEPKEELETVDVLKEVPQNPIENLELPEKTETPVEDDVYALPTDIKVGLLTKKTKKEKPQKATKTKTKKKKITNSDVEEQIEEIEQKIAGAPEPVVDLTPSEASAYDPDTIDLHDINPNDEKAKIIKEYFSTAIDKDKKAIKTKQSKKKKQKTLRKVSVILSVFLGICLLGLVGFYTYTSIVKNEKTAEVVAGFNTLSPSYVPEGYVLEKSNYSDQTKTFILKYVFSTDDKTTITFKQLQIDNPTNYVSDYISVKNGSFVEKTVDEIIFTEVDKNNLLWEKEDFMFVLETENYTLSNELLYKMAESVE